MQPLCPSAFAHENLEPGGERIHIVPIAKVAPLPPRRQPGEQPRPKNAR